MRDEQLDSETSETDPNIVKLKAAFRGPSLGKFQPLITFDSVAFLAQDYGASFILPLCLDLLQTIEKRKWLKLFGPTSSPLFESVLVSKEVKQYLLV